MGNIVPRAGREPTSLAFRASVLPSHHVGSLMSPLYLRLTVFVDLCLRGQCSLLHAFPWNYKSFHADNYKHTGNGLTYIHLQGTFTNHTAHNLYRIMVMATSVTGVPKMGNILHRAGLESAYLVSHWQASVLPIHHIGSLTSLLYPHSPLCLSGQCRLLQY